MDLNCDRDRLNVGDVVRIGVRRVANVPSLVYVVLLDFNKIPGSLRFSELGNFSRLVKFSQSVKFKELRRSSESQKLSDFLPRDLILQQRRFLPQDMTRFIMENVYEKTFSQTVYLTLRGISEHKIVRCREDHENNRLVHVIMENVYEKTEIDISVCNFQMFNASSSFFYFAVGRN